MKIEARDVNPRALLWAAAALVVVVGVLAAGLRWWMLAHGTAPSPQAPVPREVPGPRLQPHPTIDMVRLRAADKQALEAYGWVDRERGVVRVPLDRAMDLTLRRGLPAREAPPAP